MQCCECHLPEFMSELSTFDFEPERFECENDESSSETVSSER